MQDITQAVRELVHHRAPSMDHIEALLRLFTAEVPLTGDDVARLSRLDPATVAGALDDLVTSGLASGDRATSYRFAPRGPDDRSTVEALAVLYNQRPVTLVKLVYEQPSMPVKSFAEAFRLKKPHGEE